MAENYKELAVERSYELPERCNRNPWVMASRGYGEKTADLVQWRESTGG